MKTIVSGGKKIKRWVGKKLFFPLLFFFLFYRFTILCSNAFGADTKNIPALPTSGTSFP